MAEIGSQAMQPAPAQPAQPGAMAEAQPMEGKKKKGGWLKWVIIILVVLIVGGGLWFWLAP